jgi:hypothetical protein
MNSKVHVGLTHGEPTPDAFWRSQSRGWFGSRVIDLDPERLLAHDL